MSTTAQILSQCLIQDEHMLFCSDYVELSRWHSLAAKAWYASGRGLAGARGASGSELRRYNVPNAPGPFKGMFVITEKRVLISDVQGVFSNTGANRFEAVYDPEYAKARIQTSKNAKAQLQQPVRLRVITGCNLESGLLGGNSLKLETYVIHMNERTQKAMRMMNTMAKVSSLGTTGFLNHSYKLEIMRPLTPIAKASVIGTLMIPGATALAETLARNSQKPNATYEPLQEIIRPKAQVMSSLVNDLSALAAV
jgi:hypothetical protein